ncbi:hypothetical protein SAMN04487819_1266 [Actinopolyspora alba]|uniref:Uncharacterized protein n=2 Tax=Actinopolyspora alba TaxID=673379 RepID=A0A1I2CLL3_9ACTN|nr:hypothetical protein SAMN04487819_1266 [Actinopolyspora alba]
MWMMDHPVEATRWGWRVWLVMKIRLVTGELSRQGNMISVTLDSPPDAGIAVGARVELVEPYMRAYETTTLGKPHSLLEFRASALRPAS